MISLSTSFRNAFQTRLAAEIARLPSGAVLERAMLDYTALLSVRGLDPRWVVPSYGKTGHIVCWEHKLVPDTLHSLRHTFATVGVEAGPEEVMGRLLNHASKTITGQRSVKPKLHFLRSGMAMVVEELQRRLGDRVPV